MKLYELLQAALDGSYQGVDANFFAGNGASRLRARVQEANNSFSDHMRDHGQRRKVSTHARPSKSTDRESINETAELIVSKAEMMQWVKEAYRRTRGRELPGNNNWALLSELFHEQSSRWGGIAEDHIQKIVRIASQWIEAATKKLIPEDRLRSEVRSMLLDWLENSEKAASTELRRLLDDEKDSPLTYNHYYTDNVQKSRLDAQKAAVRLAVAEVAQHEWGGKLHISNQAEDLDRFLSAIESRINVDMDEQACKEALTELDSYYKVDRKTFVDNVARQVVERHIISPLPKAFCPNSVSQLSDEDLERIGSEPDARRQRRELLSRRAESLRKSLSELQKPPSLP